MYPGITVILFILSFTTVGAVLASKRPSNPIGWLLLASGLSDALGTFSIFIQGLSGEATTVKGPDNKDIVLRKTLQLEYQIRGDEIFPGQDEVVPKTETWIMR